MNKYILSIIAFGISLILDVLIVAAFHPRAGWVCVLIGFATVAISNIALFVVFTAREYNRNMRAINRGRQ